MTEFKFFTNLENCLKFASEKKDEFIFASDTWNERTNVPSKMFSSTVSYTHFWDATKDVKPEEKAYYEIVKGDMPHRLFADVEWPDISWKSVEEVKEWFFKLMESKGLKHKNFYVLNASEGKKGSLHIYGDYIFKNIDCQKAFWGAIRKELLEDEKALEDWFFIEATDTNLISKSPLDFGVYNKNRQFRLPFSSKMSKHGELKRPLKPTSSKSTFSDYIISRVDEDFKTIEVKVEEGVNTAKKVMVSKELLTELFKKYKCNYVGTKGNIILLKNMEKNRKCLIGGEDNYSDNAFGLIRKEGVYYCCHDENCKGKKRLIYNKYDKEDAKDGLSDEIPFHKWIKMITDNPGDNEALNSVKNEMNSYFAKIIGSASPFYMYRQVDEQGLVIWKPKCKKALSETFEGHYVILGKRQKTLLELWYKFPYIRVYNTINACPLDAVSGKDNFNPFTGLVIDKETAFSKGNFEDGKKIADFIKNTWCHGNEEISEWVIGYLAHLVQKPFVKVRKTLVLKSVEGAGKSFIVNKIGRMIGNQWYFQPSSPDEIFGNFNSQLRNKSLVFLDEMSYGGNKREDGQLKKLITEDNLTTNEKFMVHITTTNKANYILASNIDWIIPVGAQARRYVVLELKEGMSVMTSREKTSLLSVSDESFARYLYSIDLDSWESDKEINTDALLEQKLRNLNDPISWMYQGVKEETDFPFEKELAKKDVYNMFKLHFPNTRTSNIAFWKDIRKVFKIEESRPRIEGKQVSIVKMPSKDDLKPLLEIFLKQKI
jgi:Tfp pilus assembly protein PilZ